MKVYIIDEGELYTILQYNDRVLRVNSKTPYYRQDMIEEHAKSRKNLFTLEHFDCSGKATKDVVLAFVKYRINRSIERRRSQARTAPTAWLAEEVERLKRDRKVSKGTEPEEQDIHHPDNDSKCETSVDGDETTIE